MKRLILSTCLVLSLSVIAQSQNEFKGQIKEKSFETTFALSANQVDELESRFGSKIVYNADIKKGTVIGNTVRFSSVPFIKSVRRGSGFTVNGIKVATLGLSTNQPISEKRVILNGVVSVQRDTDYSLVILNKDNNIVGKINTLFPIISADHIVACSGSKNSDDRVIEIAINKNGLTEYIYGFVSIASTNSLNGIKNLPLIEFKAGKRCIPRQSINGIDAGLGPVNNG